MRLLQEKRKFSVRKILEIRSIYDACHTIFLKSQYRRKYFLGMRK